MLFGALAAPTAAQACPWLCYDSANWNWAFPRWACPIAQESDLLDGYELAPTSQQFPQSGAVNPFILYGDFDGDQQLDVAVRMRHEQTGNVGMAFIYSGDRAPFVFHGLSGGTPTSLDAFTVLSVYPQRQIVRDFGLEATEVVRDGLLLVKPDSSSGLIYFDGTQYHWRWLGD